MLFYLALILTGACALLICVNTKYGILLTLVSKPIIDTTWDESFFGLKQAYIIGVVVPIVVIFKFFSGHANKKEVPLLGLWLVYIGFNYLSAQMIIWADPKAGFETFFKVLNGFGGYLMFVSYFDNPADFRKLILAMLIAGLFPIGIGMYQFATGHVRHVLRIRDITIWEHIRNVGLYDNMINLKYYIFQPFAAILLYWSYFIEKGRAVKIVLVGYFLCGTIVLYKCYTKAGYAEFAIWIVIWCLFTKNYRMLFLVLIGTAVVGVYISFGMFEAVRDIYSKDLAYLAGEGDVTMTFGGRYPM